MEGEKKTKENVCITRFVWKIIEIVHVIFHDSSFCFFHVYNCFINSNWSFLTEFREKYVNLTQMELCKYVFSSIVSKIHGI